MDLMSYNDSYLSLLAPIVALGCAAITLRVLPSLAAGIIVGALLLTQFSVVDSLSYIASSFFRVFWDDGFNTSSVFIILFLLILGIITTLVEISGGARAFGEWARERVKTRQGSQLITVLLGLIIFIDDYFNALAVGSIGRPLTDRQGVSRAKLAYLIDSTAAPMCVIMPISSWGAYIIALIGGILAAHGLTDTSAIAAFISLVPMNFYAVFALAMVVCVAYLDLNIGPMRHHELRAREGELYDRSKGIPAGLSDTLDASGKGSVADLAIPILTLTLATTCALIGTGALALAEAGKAFSLLGAFENTNVVNSLVYGGLSGLAVTTVRMFRHNMNLSKWRKAVVKGAGSMMPAIYILIFAWMLVDAISSLETGSYLASLVSNSQLSPGYLPMIMFVVAGVMAFSTGSSWGTFGIMLPIAGDMAASADIAMMLPMLASVLAGAVFGDHCSPISDTTILSSAGASCHHIDHVATQLPYALGVTLVSLTGYWALGLTGSAALGFLAALLVFAALLVVFKGLSGTARVCADR